MKINLKEMLAAIPTEQIEGKNLDKIILRIGIQSELDAINLYEQLAELSTDDDVKNTLLSIAKEEKTHVGEFEKLLNFHDKENQVENEKGEDEVEEADYDGDLKEARDRLYGKTSAEKFNLMMENYHKLNPVTIKK